MSKKQRLSTRRELRRWTEHLSLRQTVRTEKITKQDLKCFRSNAQAFSAHIKAVRGQRVVTCSKVGLRARQRRNQSSASRTPDSRHVEHVALLKAQRCRSGPSCTSSAMFRTAIGRRNHDVDSRGYNRGGARGALRR